jgi:hypothetical protein
MVRVCAHCLKPVSRHDFAGSADLLAAHVAASRAGHAAVCSIPVRATFTADRPRVPTRSSSLLRPRP